MWSVSDAKEKTLNGHRILRSWSDELLLNVEFSQLQISIHTSLSMISCRTCWFPTKASTPLSGTLCSVLHIGHLMCCRFCRAARHFKHSVCEHGRSFGSWYSSKHTGHSVISAIATQRRLCRHCWAACHSSLVFCAIPSPESRKATNVQTNIYDIVLSHENYSNVF